MKIFILFLAFLYTTVGVSQKPQTIKLHDLQKIINARTEKIQIINFWATWCGPCVKELPLFEKLNAAARDNIQVTLVSLDLDLDPDPEKVYKFIARKNIRSQVLLLNEDDPNSWIDKVDKAWNGALPATIFINQKTGERKFIGKELREGELEKYIEEMQ